MPVLPFITDGEEDIRELVRLAHEAHAKFIHADMGVTLRQNQRDYYFDQLDRHFPGMKERYTKRYGVSYYCATPGSERLYRILAEECDRYGILHDMKKIIKAYKKDIAADEQTSLF